MSKRRQYIFLGACAAVSAFFLWLFLRGTDWSEMGRAFRNASLFWVIMAILPIPILYVIRAIRWRIFVAPVQRIPVHGMFTATCIGFMASNMLPLRLGEIIRPVVLKFRWKLGLWTGLASVMVERVLDLVALGAFLAAVLIIPPGHAKMTGQAAEAARQAASSPAGPTISLTYLRVPGLVVAAVTLGLAVFIILLRLYPGFILRLAEKPLRLLPRFLRHHIEKMLKGIEGALHFVNDIRQVILAVFLSIVIWILAAASMYFSCRAFGADVGIMGACLCFVCAALAVALPQAP